MLHVLPRGVIAVILALGVLAPTVALPGAALADERAVYAQPERDSRVDDRGNGHTVELQLLAINDFHGGLQPRTVAGRPAGGAAVLASYLDAAEKEAKGATTLRLGAGDLIGGSPPISALLQDEPTIEALDAMKFDYSSVGNHEFDEGLAELRRLQHGGCHPDTGCFKGASMKYLAANVVDGSGTPVFPPYVIENVKGVPVGLIGVVLEETPTIVTPSGVAGLTFLDEADTVNRYVGELKEQGVETIVVMIHQGGFVARGGNLNGGPLTGSIVDIVQRIDDEVDVVLSGHTHAGYQAIVDGKLVTEAFANGTAYADVDLVLDRQTRDVVSKNAQIVTTFADAGPGLDPDRQVARIVEAAAQEVAPIVNEVVATAADAITREQTPAGESELGNLIADAQRWKMGTQIAAMNPGGIREDLAAGEVTYGELFTVQPFGNDLVKMTLTGDQLYTLFNQQWSLQGDGSERYRPLQVSGITVTWDDSRPRGDRIVSLALADGTPIDRGADYTITVNSFLADGGDNFTVLRDGRNRVVGPTDLDALIEYVKQLPQPFNSMVQGRITVV